MDRQADDLALGTVQRRQVNAAQRCGICITGRFSTIWELLSSSRKEKIAELSRASSDDIKSRATRVSLVLGGSESASLDSACSPPAGSETLVRGGRASCATLVVAYITVRHLGLSTGSPEEGGRRALVAPSLRRSAPPHAAQLGSGDVRPR